MSSTVKPLANCFVGTSSGPVYVHEGEDYDTDHPLVQAHPALFTEPAPEPKRPILSRKGKDADA